MAGKGRGFQTGIGGTAGKNDNSLRTEREVITKIAIELAIESAIESTPLSVTLYAIIRVIKAGKY
jgi:hypothetical protein